MQIVKAAIVGAMLAAALAPAALAKGGKDFYVQDYQFDRPMSGYEGRAGNYYCSYQRLPNRVCVTDSNGKPLGGVTVTLNSGTVQQTSTTPTTGNVGHFEIDNLAPHGARLRVRLPVNNNSKETA